VRCNYRRKLAIDQRIALETVTGAILQDIGSVFDSAIHEGINMLMSVFVLLGSAIYNNQPREHRVTSIPEHAPHMCSIVARAQA
jgi:hypothetical protein